MASVWSRARRRESLLLEREVSVSGCLCCSCVKLFLVLGACLQRQKRGGRDPGLHRLSASPSFCPTAFSKHERCTQTAESRQACECFPDLGPQSQQDGEACDGSADLL